MLHFINFDILRNFFITIQPFAVIINVLLGTFISVITLYLFFKSRPRKIKTEMLKPGSIIINWSGHPLPGDTAWITPFQVWTPKEQPHFNVESWETIQISVLNMINRLPKDIEHRLLQGDPDIILVLPQLAAGVSVLLAILHGRIGVFPSITSPLRKADGSFWLPEPINLGSIRLNSRYQREIES
ncbi:MAG: hypothetical protein HUU50_08620 [Candidatus Brocadiae bacterium]|nr:hypothetical protein [Candidatus Brocadiia bacterium]